METCLVDRLPTGDDAYNFEQTVLRHWRDELGLSAPVAPDAMPQGGATETVSARDVSPEDVLSFVLRAMEEQGITEPNVTMAEGPWQLPTS